MWTTTPRTTLDFRSGSSASTRWATSDKCCFGSIPFDSAPSLFIKITGGIIHGYKFPFNKKIPLNNRHGWGITAIPALGYDFNRNWGAQVNVLGNAGVMFQLNYTVR